MKFQILKADSLGRKRKVYLVDLPSVKDAEAHTKEAGQGYFFKVFVNKPFPWAGK